MLENHKAVAPNQNPAGAGRTEVNLDDYRMALDHALNAPHYGYFAHDSGRIHFAENHVYGKPVKAFTIVALFALELW